MHIIIVIKEKINQKVLTYLGQLIIIKLHMVKLYILQLVMVK